MFIVHQIQNTREYPDIKFCFVYKLEVIPNTKL